MTFKVKYNLKSKFIPFWAFRMIACHPTKLGPEMHLSTVKIPIDFGLDKPSASISFLIIKAIFFTYLCCFCITFSETIVVNISETIGGFWLNQSAYMTELTFCSKSSMNILIDNRYCNRFIHLRRPIFPENHNDASLCLQSRPHLGSRMRLSVLNSQGSSHPICELSRIITTPQLDALTVLMTVWWHHHVLRYFNKNINPWEAARTSSPNIAHSAWMHDIVRNAIFISLIC